MKIKLNKILIKIKSKLINGFYPKKKGIFIRTQDHFYYNYLYHLASMYTFRLTTIIS